MFTGAIKLAKIDDYINPGQSCIQPHIMKKDIQTEKATVTLNDCLACSGCITSAQSILVEQMSVDKLLSKSDIKNINQSQAIFLMVSPQTIVSLANYYKQQPGIVFKSINSLFQMYFPNFVTLIDLQIGINMAHQMIWEQYQNKSNTSSIPILCSECPGWVCYAQKTLTESITQLMSTVKSPQQILGRLIKSLFKNQKNYQAYVVGVMPCYDKKLQAIRFNYETSKQVDLTITSGELLVLINETLKKNSLPSLSFQNEEQLKPRFHKNFSQEVQNIINLLAIKPNSIYFIKDQTSNGYLQFIINRLGVKPNVKEIKNNDFIEYTFLKLYHGKVLRIQKYSKNYTNDKKNKCPYQYIQIMACPGGCFGGGGQIKIDNDKVKDTIQDLKSITKNQQKIIIIQNVLWNYLNRQQSMVKYKPIQKNLANQIANW